MHTRIKRQEATERLALSRLEIENCFAYLQDMDLSEHDISSLIADKILADHLKIEKYLFWNAQVKWFADNEDQGSVLVVPEDYPGEWRDLTQYGTY